MRTTPRPTFRSKQVTAGDQCPGRPQKLDAAVSSAGQNSACSGAPKVLGAAKSYDDQMNLSLLCGKGHYPWSLGRVRPVLSLDVVGGIHARAATTVWRSQSGGRARSTEEVNE